MFSHTALLCGGLVLVSRAGDDVTPRLGHVKGSSGGGSRRVQPHTLGNSVARRDITSAKQVELRHLSIKRKSGDKIKKSFGKLCYAKQPADLDARKLPHASAHAARQYAQFMRKLKVCSGAHTPLIVRCSCCMVCASTPGCKPQTCGKPTESRHQQEGLCFLPLLHEESIFSSRTPLRSCLTLWNFRFSVREKSWTSTRLPAPAARCRTWIWIWTRIGTKTGTWQLSSRS